MATEISVFDSEEFEELVSRTRFENIKGTCRNYFKKLKR
jgi:hypothetical protein